MPRVTHAKTTPTIGQADWNADHVLEDVAPAVHTHDYADPDHLHPHSHPENADSVHSHSYADPNHSHDTEHSHTAADVGAAQTAHTHDTTHDHSGEYAPPHTEHAHSHTASEVGASATTHNHDGSYAPTHSHPYAGTSHNHDAAYAPIHTHPYAATSHTHTLTDSDIPAAIARDTEVTAAITAHLSAATHGAGGAATEKAVVVGSDVPNTSSTTAVNAISTVDLGTGTYLFKAWVAWKTAATTTGVEMWANHTGTVSRFVSTWYTLTTGGAAATGVADQATTLTAQMLEGKAQRVKDTASGPIQGTDTANADQFAVMEGIAIVTATGNFEIKFRSEVNGSAATVLAGTTLELRKVA